MTLQAEAGATIDTEVYVNDSETEESLLGEKDAERLGIIQVRIRGGSEAVEVRRQGLQGYKGNREDPGLQGQNVPGG